MKTFSFPKQAPAETVPPHNAGFNSVTTLSLSRSRIYTGSLILVNAKYPCRKPSGTTLVPIDTQPAILLERQAAVLLGCLMDYLHGWRSITPVSGWRSLQEQQKIWDNSLLENGPDFTSTYVAVPGHSEHQTGLAVDLGLRKEKIDFIRPDFPYRGICQIFRDKAADFGFVERYPRDKEWITGIGHEPWHFRYVGVPHAAIMKEQDLTLEEYIDYLRQFPYGTRCCRYKKDHREVFVSYLSAGNRETTTLSLNGTFPYSVSGNNVDGFIITEWREAYGQENCLRRA